MLIGCYLLHGAVCGAPTTKVTSIEWLLGLLSVRAHAVLLRWVCRQVCIVVLTDCLNTYTWVQGGHQSCEQAKQFGMWPDTALHITCGCSNLTFSTHSATTQPTHVANPTRVPHTLPCLGGALWFESQPATG